VEAAPDDFMYTLPIEIHGRHFDVPIRVHLHIVNLREQLSRNVAGHPAVRNLLAFAEHCLSAADEGEDYAVPREWLDAMTTLGLMEKVGRAKWAPTDAAKQFVLAAPTSAATPGGQGDEFVVKPIEDAFYRWLDSTPVGRDYGPLHLFAAGYDAALAQPVASAAPVGYEFVNEATGHRILHESHAGLFTPEKGYVARPLVYAASAAPSAVDALPAKWRVTSSMAGQGSAGNKARRQCADELEAALAHPKPDGPRAGGEES
jgi:hypothetical protein